MEAPKIKRVFDSKTRESIADPKEPYTTPVELISEALVNDVYYPQGVYIEDIDISVIELFKKYFDFNIGGNKIPLFDFSNQRFGEKYVASEMLTNNDTLNPPFLILTKSTMPEVGTNLDKRYNLANNELHTVKNVQRIDSNGKVYYESYKVPQPVNIDIKYTLEFIGETIKEVNKIAEKIFIEFAAREVYIQPKGYFMPVVYSSSSDESEHDLEKRRFYSQKYEFLCKGYLLNGENFVVLKSFSDFKLNLSTYTAKEGKRCFVKYDNECVAQITFPFTRKGDAVLTYEVETNIDLTSVNINDLSDFVFKVNDVEVNLPITLVKNDIFSVQYLEPIAKNFSVIFFS